MSNLDDNWIFKRSSDFPQCSCFSVDVSSLKLDSSSGQNVRRKEGKRQLLFSYHIHEWRRRRRLIKFWIPDQLLTDWFTTSFVPKIARDIDMGACVTEEQAIARAQYLDLVYSQSGTLYEYLSDAPRPGTSKAPPKPSADGVIGSVNPASKKSSSNPGKQNSGASNENTSQGG